MGVQVEIVIPVRNQERDLGPGRRPARPGAVAGQLVRFVVVGVASTVAYVVLYLLLRGGMVVRGPTTTTI